MNNDDAESILTNEFQSEFNCPNFNASEEYPSIYNTEDRMSLYTQGPNSIYTPGGNLSISENKKKSKSRSKLIDKMLKEEAKKKKESEPDLKILILGSSNSGKSTLLKQMRQNFSKKYTMEELDYFHVVIIENVITIIKLLVEGLELLGLDKKLDENYQNDAAKIKYFQWDKTIFVDKEITEIIIRLWNFKEVKECCNRKNELKSLNFSFMDSASRIFDPIFSPTNQDVICCRKPTYDIKETRLLIKDCGNLLVYDVGGQKSLRQYWVPYFSDVHGIIFLVDMSSYDMMMEEDSETNRMMDSLNLFESITKNKLLEVAQFILFLNKVDLFEEKLKKSKIVDHFSDFIGDQLSDKVAKKYFQKKFEERAGRMLLSIQFTNSTDSRLMKKVIVGCMIIIRTVALKSIGVIS
ncbi:hypothetical protein HDU92_007382 [Lobulomyces angularis]|nr:hypothetical protein HDU92_007382 [Lobulomyces angularis]